MSESALPRAERPYLSVIVPAYNGVPVLPRCLEALQASDLPRGEWELLVVDDGSTDGTAELARGHADEVIRLPGPPRGPAFGRNRGVERARGEVVVFVDADVCVHPDVLGIVARRFRESDEVGGLFGAYDDAPAHPGFLSQYRNLLHRYVHLRGEGKAETFWAGCGAIRTAAFRSVGGFDEDRFPRPQIEDIELGYRLSDAGHAIFIDPSVQAKHLKRWGLIGMVRTDIFDRGIPWMRLLRERGDRGGSLNVKTGEKVRTGLVGLALLALGVAPFWGKTALAVAGALVLVGVLGSIVPLYRWFLERRGLGFALAVVPMQLLYYVINGISAAGGIALHKLRGPPRQRPPEIPTSRGGSTEIGENPA